MANLVEKPNLVTGEPQPGWTAASPNLVGSQPNQVESPNLVESQMPNLVEQPNLVESQSLNQVSTRLSLAINQVEPSQA